MTADAPPLIRVDREHIARGVPKNPNFCPIAIAAREQLPGAGLATVEMVEHPGERREARLVAGGIAFTLIDQEGMDATEFLLRFDAGQAVEPAVYYVQQYIADGEERQKRRPRLGEQPLHLFPRAGRQSGGIA